MTTASRRTMLLTSLALTGTSAVPAAARKRLKCEPWVRAVSERSSCSREASCGWGFGAQFAGGREDVIEAVGRVGIVDDDVETTALGVDQFEAAWDAGQLL